ncbi:MAG: DUF4012 domain-containing protein [Patescibacteria group bacterium]
MQKKSEKKRSQATKQKSVMPLKREIPIRITTGPHRVSEFLVTTRPALFSEPVYRKNVPTNARFNVRGIWIAVQPYVFQISTTTLFAFLGWVIVRIAVLVFWLPDTAGVMPRVIAVKEKRQSIFAGVLASARTSFAAVATSTRPATDVTLSPVSPLPKQRLPKKSTEPAWSFQFFSIWRALIPRSLSFAAFSFALALPIWFVGQISIVKAVSTDVIGSMKVGVQSFVDGASSFQLGQYDAAGSTFEASLENFKQAKQQLDKLPVGLTFAAAALPQGETLASVRHVIDAANDLAAVASEVTTSLALFESEQNKAVGDDVGSALTALRSLAEKAIPQLTNATQSLSLVDAESLPQPYAEFFGNLQGVILPPLKEAVQSLTLIQFIEPRLLGVDRPQRYLFVFQDDYELRASGGFMGSFALLDVSKGSIQNIEFPGGGSYDLEGSLAVQEKPPHPLSLVASRWEFQDANWWVDWPTSAKKIAWFYDHSGGSTVDGVIAVDTQFMKRVLSITGPIDMPKYGIMVDEHNFIEQILNQVEVHYDRTENKPKQILADLLPIVTQKLSERLPHDGISVLTALRQSLAEKHILVYSRDAATERALDGLGWAGALVERAPQSDSLSVVNTNIAGQKTDGVITDSVVHNVTANSDGSLEVSLAITRQHNGVKGTPFTGVRNVDYMRIYVPEGSQLVNAVGFETIDPSLFKSPAPNTVDDADIQATTASEHYDMTTGITDYRELSRTVFAGWLTLDPGQKKTVQLTYRLPWRFSEVSNRASVPWLTFLTSEPSNLGYTFYWEKQPGTVETTLSHYFVAPGENLDLVRSSIPPVRSDTGWLWQLVPRTDTAFITLFKKR